MKTSRRYGIAMIATIGWALPLGGAEDSWIARSKAPTEAAAPGDASMPDAAPRLAGTPSEEDIFRFRIFPEALVPVRPTLPQENSALAHAIDRYLARRDRIDPTPINDFLAAHPSSPWRASLLANLGTLYAQQGYFNRAFEAWREAWEAGKDTERPGVLAVAHYALGEALALATRLGNARLIEAHLQLLGDRHLRGPAESKLWLAQYTLVSLRRFPEGVIPSGPRALQEVLSLRAHPEVPDLIRRYTPTSSGMSLAELRALAEAVGWRATTARRVGTADPSVPSIVHLRFGHFSAVVAADRERRRYLLRDPALGGDFWMSADALTEETSGYALVLAGGLREGWIPVPDAEATLIVGYSCYPNPPNQAAPPCDTSCCVGGPGAGASGGGSSGGCGSSGCGVGLATYTLNPVDASLVIRDVPLLYAPARGPEVRLAVTYKSRDDVQPQVFSFGNLGYRWTFDWLSYVEEYPAMSMPESARVYLRGGGEEWHHGPPTAQGEFRTNFRRRVTLIRTSVDPIRYERRLPDGGVEVFAQPDGAPAGQWQRRIFLSEAIDPRGQRLSFGYDESLRLVTVTDAVGQVTTLSYEHPADPLKVTRVTDPFGRTALFAYHEGGQLASITDAAGMVSSFTYSVGDYVGALTTPYGMTTFRHETRSAEGFWDPYVEATDPLRGTERLEYRWESAELPQTEPAAVVPDGFAAANANLHKYNSLYWDTGAWSRAPGDPAQATLTHWLGYVRYPDANSQPWADPTPHSVKRPLENRVWYAYPGQSLRDYVGTHSTPSMAARVLDDGTTQAWQTTYNTQGQATSRSDPLGHQTTYVYAANGVDLLEVRQTSPGVNDLLASYGDYNAQHLPGTVTDAAGQTTTYTYNAAGQVLTVTTPPRGGISENRTTTYAYDGNGRLLSVTRPAEGPVITYTYDAFGRVRTVTDEDGATLTTDYDALNRPTRVSYPDGSYEETTYQRLDAVARRDRAGRLTRSTYDALGRLVATRDPAGRTIVQAWTGGALRRLIDANGNATTWERDAAGRVTRELRADGLTATIYTYEPATGRLQTVTDPKGQVTTHTYNPDDTLASTVYTNAQVPTPGVAFSYDPAYNRVATMVDGIGTTIYTYHPAGQLGAGQVASVDGPLTDDTITYSYDELGHVVSRAINGVALTYAYDALGRVTSETNVLGTFTYGYDGVTGHVASVAYPNGQTSAYSYYPASQDHRLETIHHRYPDATTLSKFDYTYDAVGNIVTWRQQADTVAVAWEYGYDAADQLTAAIKRATDPQATILQRYYYRYDPAGNRLSEQIGDEVTSWTYDRLNRQVTQTAGGRLKIRGHLDEPGTVTIDGQPALVTAAGLFEGTAAVAPGTTTFTIAAKDFSGNEAVRQYEVDTAGGSKMFTFDANGNLTSDGTRTFEWDARNQLVAVTVGTHRSEFSYDGKQRRVRIVEKESSVVQSDTKVIWCQTAICEERAADGVTVARRAFKQGEQVADTPRFFATDHLGSVSGLTDGSALRLAWYAFDPSGKRVLSAGAELTGVGFTGHVAHAPSATYLTLYRAYDPDLTRWLSEDPLGFGAGPNLYAYARNEPIRLVDPDGRSPIAGGVVIGGIVGGPPGAVVGGIIGAGIGLVVGLAIANEINKQRCDADRPADCYDKYSKAAAWCGATFTDDRIYNKCMDWAWANYLRCINGVPPRNFEPWK